MLNSLLERVIPNAAKGSDKNLLAACQDLESIQAGLALGVCDYILKGTNDSVIATLQAVPEEQFHDLILGQVNPMSGVYSLTKAQLRPFIRQSTALFNFMRSDAFVNKGIARRFANVINIHSDDFILNAFHDNADMPTWLKALIERMSAAYQNDYQFKKVTGNYTFLSTEWLLELAKDNDVPAKAIWTYLVEGASFSSHASHPVLSRCLTDINFVDLCLQQDFITLIPSFSATAKVSLIKQLAKSKDLSSVVSVVVNLNLDSAKSVRNQASVLFRRVDEGILERHLQANFAGYKTAARKLLPALAAQHLTNAARLLDEWKSNEKTVSVVNEISSSLLNCKAAKQTHNADNDSKLPEFTCFPDSLPLPDSLKLDCFQAYEKLLISFQKSAEYEEQSNKDKGHRSHWAKDRFLSLQKVTEEDIVNALAVLESGQGDISDELFEIFKQARVLENSNVHVIHLFNYLHKFSGYWTNPFEHSLYQQIAEQSVPKLSDFRQATEYFERKGYKVKRLKNCIFDVSWTTAYNQIPGINENVLLWPFLVENMATLEKQFLSQGVKTGESDPNNFSRTLFLIQQLPSLPSHFVPQLYEIALGNSKTHRLIARQTLSHFGADVERITKALESTKQEQRIQAARWLVNLQATSAVGALASLVKKEKREAVKAECLSALSLLGQDISCYLSPEILLAEALEGLKKAAPKSMAWFPLQHLPELKFATGNIVDARIIQWWVVLSVKLKEPADNPLMMQYLQLLDEKSKQNLASFVLSVFIAEDTKSPSDEDAHQYAQANKVQMLADWQHWWGENYKDKTLEDAYQYLFNEKKRGYLGSAIKDKGMLCLVCGMMGADAVTMVSRYMKDHYTRRHQIEAILKSLANSNDMAITQLILSTARRHRTKSIQTVARSLIEVIAKRNSWTQDELADRTIPTAGFEHVNERQTLNYGSRELTLTLSPSLKIEVHNEQGNLLKALPQARQGDNAEAVTESKKLLSANKKELKQVVELQSARLTDAACCDRVWSFADWNEYLWQHPVMYFLVQRVVWQFESNGQWLSARPSEDAALLDLEDDELEVDSITRVRLVSSATLSEAEIKSWKQHLKDFKVKPLFDQFSKACFDFARLDVHARFLDHYRGRLTDTYTLRNLLTKRGYKRGNAEDGGVFYHYSKEIHGSGYRLVFEFSGSALPEENVAAAIYRVGVLPIEKENWGYERDFVPLKQVHQNLLNVMALDYEAIADKCILDPDWETKLPW